MNASTLVQKLWNYCNVLRDDGMSYGDYVEQLTYLLFLKMADERSRPPYSQASLIPTRYSWAKLLAKDGLTRAQRVRKWYDSNPRRPEVPPEPFLTPKEIRAQILATFPRD